MSYCPNCGQQVKEEHYYCGQCGYTLAEIGDETDQIPPTGLATSRQGFLSGRSREYLTDILNEERELDSETVAYSNLSSDVGAGLADFATVALVKEINLLALVLDNTSDSDVLSKDVQKLNLSEMEERMMWMGLLLMPRLYDDSFGTEWVKEFSEDLKELFEKGLELHENSEAT